MLDDRPDAPAPAMGRPLLRQRWDSITFVHWRYPAEAVQPLVPAGIAVEEIDGSAWVGVIPFTARNTRLAWPGEVRLLPDFPETNVRTYVRTRRGRAAVWFFSLDAGSAALVAAAQATLGVPYRWADMRVGVEAERYEYVGRRRGSDARYRLEVRRGERLAAAETPDLYLSLTARWRAVVPRGGAGWVVPVRHDQWELHRAEVIDCEENLLRKAGLPAPSAPPEALWSPGVDAALGAPRRC